MFDPHTELLAALRKGGDPRAVVRALRGFEPNHDPVPFTMLSGPIIASRAMDEQGNAMRVISGTTSSTDKDLYDTRMSPKALESMRKSALENLTIFLNHDYTVPESIFGSVVRATRKNRDGFMDLDIDVRVLPEGINPRADKAYASIQAGTKLGFSIGALILDWEWQAQDGTPLKDFDPWDDWDAVGDTAIFTMLDVLLVESSLVGVPANRRSWIKNGWNHQARRALRKANLLPDDWQSRPEGKSEMPENDAATIQAQNDQAARDANPTAEYTVRRTDDGTPYATNISPGIDTVHLDAAGNEIAVTRTAVVAPDRAASVPASDPDAALLSVRTDLDAAAERGLDEDESPEADAATLAQLEAAFYASRGGAAPQIHGEPLRGLTEAQRAALPDLPAIAPGEPMVNVRGESRSDPVALDHAQTITSTLDAQVRAGEALLGKITAAFAQLGVKEAEVQAQVAQFEARLAEALDIGLYQPTNRRAVKEPFKRANPDAPLTPEELINMDDAAVLQAMSSHLIS